MYSDVEMQLAYKIGNAPINLYPYPHIYVEDVFPKDFYDRIQENLPDPKMMIPIENARPVKGYKERFVMELSDKHLGPLPEGQRQFWKEMHSTLVVRGYFSKLVFSKFKTFVEQRFQGKQGLEFHAETLLVEDITNYKLGPHTDSPRKVITMLFYLPCDHSQKHLGTSIYLPNNPDFVCAGGPHHSREHFSRLHTNPFLPNSLFAFVKTDNSFHGVEPVADAEVRRWLLLYDIFVRERAPRKPSGASVSAQMSSQS